MIEHLQFELSSSSAGELTAPIVSHSESQKSGLE
jgi:hypothetical protein